MGCCESKNYKKLEHDKLIQKENCNDTPLERANEEKNNKEKKNEDLLKELKEQLTRERSAHEKEINEQKELTVKANFALNQLKTTSADAKALEIVRQNQELDIKDYARPRFATDRYIKLKNQGKLGDLNVAKRNLS